MLVSASNLDLSILSNFVDDDLESFSGDLRDSNRYILLDFGVNFNIKIFDKFTVQARKYFSNRAYRSYVYGSNDGKNWTKLTDTLMDNAENMTDLHIIDSLQNTL